MTFSGALGTRVTRRIFGLFVACAFLPVGLTIALSYGRVHEALLEQRMGQLRDAAASYGNAVVERLNVADVLARFIADSADPGRALSAREGAVGPFRAALVIEPTGQTVVFGTPTQLPTLAGLETHPGDGATVIVMPRSAGEPRVVWLVRTVATTDVASRRLALELDTRYLWGANDELPYQTEICALDARSEPLNCSRPLSERVLALLRAKTASEPRGNLAWEADGTRYLSGYHELFLKGRFGTGSWSIVATQPEEYALAAVQSVKQLVVPVVALGLLIAGLLGLVQVRRTLRPLKDLTDAIARIAARDFGARVPALGDDEFGALARSFNSMSDRLGRQFRALEAHAEIDSVILSNVDLAQVVAIVVRRMGQMARADLRFLLLADTAGARTYRIHAQVPDGLDGRSIVLSEAETRGLRAASGGPDVAAVGSLQIAALADIGIGRVFALPIVLGDELAGALILDYGKDGGVPDGEEISHLRDLADRVAVALATARRDQELHRRAHYDALTQLPNRLLGLEELGRAVAAAARHERTLAVLFVDLDGFAAVNDSLGHLSGDQLLVQAAERLRHCVRASDMVSRLGGDEFAIVLPEIREANDAALVAAHVIEALSRPFDVFRTSQVFISASVGIALFPLDATTGNDLLRHADLAMYRAKKMGRGQIAFFEISMNVEVQQRLTLERELRQALEEDQFRLYYQPQLDILSGRITGAEALIRWMHPARGLVPPGEFIAFAESSPLIEEIGRWVLSAACTQFVAWCADGIAIDHVSVNVAPRQFQRSGFAGVVAEALRKAEMPARALRLEITESAVIGQGATVEKNFADLSQLGTPLELDDFGTGYSSLAYLQRLPVSVVKLDISLIRTIESNENNRAVVRAAIDMVHALGKTVVAEGVESAGQLAVLAGLGCDSIQGYYLSPPLPAEKFAQFMRDRAANARIAA